MTINGLDILLIVIPLAIVALAYELHIWRQADRWRREDRLTYRELMRTKRWLS